MPLRPSRSRGNDPLRDGFSANTKAPKGLYSVTICAGPQCRRTKAMAIGDPFQRG